MPHGRLWGRSAFALVYPTKMNASVAVLLLLRRAQSVILVLFEEALLCVVHLIEGLTCKVIPAEEDGACEG